MDTNCIYSISHQHLNTGAGIENVMNRKKNEKNLQNKPCPKANNRKGNGLPIIVIQKTDDSLDLVPRLNVIYSDLNGNDFALENYFMVL